MIRSFQIVQERDKICDLTMTSVVWSSNYQATLCLAVKNITRVFNMSSNATCNTILVTPRFFSNICISC